MLAPGSKTLLKNIIRHTDTHNRILEESEMWRQRSGGQGEAERDRRAYMDQEPSQAPAVSRHYVGNEHDDRTGPQGTYWVRQLQKVEAADPDRWGHAGYQEMYPEEFLSSDEDEKAASKSKKKLDDSKKRKKKKKKSKKPKKTKKKHRRRDDSDSSDSESSSESEPDEKKKKGLFCNCPRRHSPGASEDVGDSCDHCNCPRTSSHKNRRREREHDKHRKDIISRTKSPKGEKSSRDKKRKRHRRKSITDVEWVEKT